MDDRAVQAAERKRRAAPAVVVMGVAGCGKSAVGQALAKALGAFFLEGDRLHPPENIERMKQGLPLSDAHRQGWLDAIGPKLVVAAGEGSGIVATCSALKRSYRDRLRGFRPDIVFVYLEIDPATARERVAGRRGHFMPASLVDSQFAILEPPGPGEAAITLDAMLPVAELVRQAEERLHHDATDRTKRG